MKNSVFSVKDVNRVCENKLGIVFRPGKEFNGWFEYGGKKIARITVPKGHSKKGIPTGTYRNMAKQLKLKAEEFDRLLECPLKYDGYVEILENDGYLEE
jgi:hypothetical protein